jgi:hypothetical protein
MHEGLFDCDDEDQARLFAADGEPGLEGRVTNDPGLAAHTQCVTMAGDHEDQRDVRARDHVGERIETVIAWPVGNRQRFVVENGDEARRIALRRNVQLSVEPRDAIKRNGLAAKQRQIALMRSMTLPWGP